MNRNGWDSEEINKLAGENIKYERKLIIFLNNILSEINSELECVSGTSNKGRFETYDLEIRYNDRKTSKVLLKIESECASELKIPWKEKIPSNWSNLSLLERKYIKLPTNSDIFIKHNMDMTSLFAIDNRWVEKLIKDKVLQLKSFNHNLKFKTNNRRYSIDMSIARNTPDHVVICENNEFVNLAGFLNKKIEEALVSNNT